jgi:hypothetical protein
VVFKGAAWARSFYAFPHQRPMNDIDLLVSPRDFTRAQDALCRAGLVRLVEHGQGPHEQNLEGDGYSFELHSELFADGRFRQSPAAQILARRTPLEDLWVPDDIGTFLVLTAHNTITDYVSARWVRTLDLHRWVLERDPDWVSCAAAARHCGLGTACWLSLEYARRTLATPIPTAVLERLRPGSLRRAYLERWLEADPGRVYQMNPNWARLGFQAWIGDSISDTFRWLWNNAPDKRATTGQAR